MLQEWEQGAILWGLSVGIPTQWDSCTAQVSAPGFMPCGFPTSRTLEASESDYYSGSASEFDPGSHSVAHPDSESDLNRGATTGANIVPHSHACLDVESD